MADVPAVADIVAGLRDAVGGRDPILALRWLGDLFDRGERTVAAVIGAGELDDAFTEAHLHPLHVLVDAAAERARTHPQAAIAAHLLAGDSVALAAVDKRWDATICKQPLDGIARSAHARLGRAGLAEALARNPAYADRCDAADVVGATQGLPSFTHDDEAVIALNAKVRNALDGAWPAARITAAIGGFWPTTPFGDVHAQAVRAGNRQSTIPIFTACSRQRIDLAAAGGLIGLLDDAGVTIAARLIDDGTRVIPAVEAALHLTEPAR